MYTTEEKRQVAKLLKKIHKTYKRIDKVNEEIRFVIKYSDSSIKSEYLQNLRCKADKLMIKCEQLEDQFGYYEGTHI